MSVQRTEPTTTDEVLSSPDKKLWEEAMQKEMKSIEENDIWDYPRVRRLWGVDGYIKRKLEVMGQ